MSIVIGRNEDFIEHARSILKSLPPIKASDKIVSPEPETCMCGKKVPITDLETVNTGCIIAVSDACKTCKEAHKWDATHYRLACIKCRRILPLRIEAHTDPDGFVYKAGKVYHVDQCAMCPDNIGKKDTQIRSVIIEKKIYQNKLKRK